MARRRRADRAETCSSGARAQRDIEAHEAERTVEARGRLENLQELVGVAREYHETADDPTLSTFLQDVSLTPTRTRSQDERGLVTLMTLHDAKGLEFRAVFVAGWRRASSRTRARSRSRALEEERRLFYVGVTRAQERLMLTHATRGRSGARAATTCRAGSSTSSARATEHERLRPASWSAYGPRETRSSRAPRSRARDGRLGPARDARRGRRDQDRARRRRDRALRSRRDGAAPDARVRAARADRVSEIEIRSIEPG